MQPGKRFTLRHDQDLTSGFDAGSPAEPFRSLAADDAASHAGEAFAAAAKGGKDKPVKVDRSSDFLAGAANGENPTPDYDEDLDTLAAFLTDGFHEYFDEERRSFDIGADGVITVQVAGISKAAKALTLQALKVWTDATGIDFKIVKKNADILVSDDNAAAYTNVDVDGNRIVSAFVNISDEWILDVNNGSGFYDYSMLTFIHELGHALGLGHAGAYGGQTGGTFDPEENFPNDSWQATVMSYFSQPQNPNVDADYALPITPMMADILAIRDLYEEEEIRTGNNVYSFKADFKAKTARTIVDDGGIDRLDFSWSKKANVIDLHEEAFSSILGVKGNLAIARGTVIEAAVGGTKGDTIIGNDYANALYGNLGKDTLTGNGGEDFFVFDTKPGAANADTITDFITGEDHLVFNNKIFTKIGADGALAEAAFAANDTGSAGDRSDRIVYNTATGELFYDLDGSKAGKAKLVAVIDAGLDLGADDVFVI